MKFCLEEKEENQEKVYEILGIYLIYQKLNNPVQFLVNWNLLFFIPYSFHYMSLNSAIIAYAGLKITERTLCSLA